jgi:hypothetical protein
MSTSIAPEPGTRWQHHSGAFYNVLIIANAKSDRPKFPPTVVYENDNGEVYSRPVSEWEGSFTQVPIQRDDERGEVIGVLSRLHTALPHVGINGWTRGIYALEFAISRLQRGLI